MTCFLGSIEVVVVPVSGYTLKVNSLKDDSHFTSDSLVSFQWFLWPKRTFIFDGMGSADLIARSTPEAPKALIREDSHPGMFICFSHPGTLPASRNPGKDMRYPMVSRYPVQSNSWL